MASIFISHSSKDKEIARQLAHDLEHYRHKAWLDEWEIHVGECIPTKVGEGIEAAEFMIVLLSQNSTNSNWVDREWKAKYWGEVNANEVQILPCLLEECPIPTLLRTKKYANFMQGYGIGFHEVCAALDYFQKKKGLKTSYEVSQLQLPTIIRNNAETIVIDINTLTAKKARLLNKSVGISNVHVLTVAHTEGQYLQFTLADNNGRGVYLDCFVQIDTDLEDIVITKARGIFYGRVLPKGFYATEFEPK